MEHLNLLVVRGPAKGFFQPWRCFRRDGMSDGGYVLMDTDGRCYSWSEQGPAYRVRHWDSEFKAHGFRWNGIGPWPEVPMPPGIVLPKD